MLSGNYNSLEVPSVFRSQFSRNFILNKPPSSSPIVTLKLLSLFEEHPTRTLQLPANIGRATDVRIRPSPRNGLFNSVFLSRHHAVIKWENERVIVEDLGSCNGTFVNGVSVKAGESWPLADGDLVMFGSEDDNGNEESSIVAEVHIEGHYSPTISNGLLKLEDDPFTAPGNDTLNPSNSQQEIITKKISSITKSLATLGVTLRTRFLNGSSLNNSQQQHLDGAIQILTSIESMIHELGREPDVSSTTSQSHLQSSTIYQKPTTAIAVNIIVSSFHPLN